MFLVTDHDGSQLDARFSVDRAHVILHSRGDAKGRHRSINTDYAKALFLVISRLSQAGIPILGAWVDSTTVQSLPLSARSILSEFEGDMSTEQICALLTGRMKHIRSDPNLRAKGGNSTKRIRIATGFVGSTEDLALSLGGAKVQVDVGSMEGLSQKGVSCVTPEHVWYAVQQFVHGNMPAQPFDLSTKCNLIADDGRRLSPKAVFRLALSIALNGAQIESRLLGSERARITLLREAGYEIVEKGERRELSDSQINLDHEWLEGGVKLRSHLTRERAPGLAKAKKAQYLRTHGRLSCERCGFDPVAHYGVDEADACIEVHHSAVHVNAMAKGHKTILEDLQCLCANCHRLVHKVLEKQKKEDAR